jgi:hypothetical protein
MALKKEQILKPTLPVEEILIKELGPEPVRVHCILQRNIADITDEAKKADVSWDIVLFHRCVKTDEGDPVFTYSEWEEFQAAHRRTYQKLSKVIARLNGLDGEENEKN